MINNVITKYLSANKRLVVPDFGAFIRKDTGEVVFVEFLKKDDGILNGLLRDSYALSENEARTLTGEFISEVKRQVAETGCYVIVGLGRLCRDNTGVYELNYDPSAQESQVKTKPVPAAAAQPEAVPVHDHGRQNDPPQEEKPKAAQAGSEDRMPGNPAGTSAYGDNATRVAATTLNDRLAQRTVIADTYGQAAPKPASPTPSPRHEPVGNMRYGKPRKPPVYQQRKKRKADTIMIIAIIAALVAIGSMIYGLYIKNDPIESLIPTSPVQHDSLNGEVPQAAEP